MRVRALRKGYAGGSLRPAGAVFDWPGRDILPGWVEAAPDSSPDTPHDRVTAPARPLSIDRALDALDPDDDAQWTRQGLPALATVQALMESKTVRRADIHVARPGFDREASRRALTAGLIRTVGRQPTAGRTI